jgi:hypothetical protein
MFLKGVIISGAKVADNGFQPFLSASTLIDQYYHSFPVDATILASQYWRNIGEQVMIIFLTLQVPMATV